MTSDRSRTEVTAEEYSQKVIQNVRNNMIELTKLSHEQKVRIFIDCFFDPLRYYVYTLQLIFRKIKNFEGLNTEFLANDGPLPQAAHRCSFQWYDSASRELY